MNLAVATAVVKFDGYRPVGRDMFDVRRFRNVYVLHLDHLAEPAFVPLDDQPQR